MGRISNYWLPTLEDCHPLLNLNVPLVYDVPPAPPVDLDHVTYPKPRAIPDPGAIPDPRSPVWSIDLDVAPPGSYPDSSARDVIMAWAAQRALEDRILEDMEAILRSRPADAPGLILIHQPTETVIMESQWIPSGTIVYTFQDQPDLMVRIDPDAPGVLRYRQTRKG